MAAAQVKQILIPQILTGLNLNVEPNMLESVPIPSSLEDVVRIIDLGKQVENHRGVFTTHSLSCPLLMIMDSTRQISTEKNCGNDASFGDTCHSR